MSKTNKYPVGGFTLIELLVVVLIIGILAAIALPQYRKAVLKSKYATMKDIVRVVKYAEQRYYMVNGGYTKNFEDLDIDYPLDNDKNLSSNGIFCSIGWWSKPNEGIICLITNTSPTLCYSDRFGFTYKYCRVLSAPESADSIQDEVCKEETGRIAPSRVDTNNIYYY